MVPTWYEEIKKFYALDPKFKNVVIEKLVNANSSPEFELVDGIQKYKNRIVIKSDEELRKRLVNAFYDFYIGGYAWI